VICNYDTEHMYNIDETELAVKPEE